MISAGSGFGPSAGGMIVYHSGLLNGFCAMASVSRVVPLVAPWNNGLAVPDHPKISAATCTGLPRGRIGRVVYEQTVLPVIVKRLDVDVLLSTCNVKPLLWRGPSVVVLQSLQYLHFPGQFSPLRRHYLKTIVSASVHAADAVITVTDWERTEAIRLLGLDPDRAVTVYHGLSEAVQAMLSAPSRPPRPSLVGGDPYVLMVSALYGFKNHHRLIRAFAAAVTRHRLPHQLVIAGPDADVTALELADLARQLGVGGRVLLAGAVPHDQVPALLAHAEAVAYVSLYETFGLPVLEALASGRPLVTSRHGATAEVAGDAARLVDAKDVDDIAAGLSDVLLDETLRRTLMRSGPERASTFTWAACAEKTAAVLDQAISWHRSGPRSRLRRTA